MVKELSEFRDVEFEDYHPGCMWGILHVLDYHYWSNVKKMLPQRKYQKKRHIRCCANPKTISIDRLQCEEDTGLLDSEANGFHVEPQIETSKTNKNLRPQLQQTGSIHNLEPSSYGLGWMNPIILIHRKTDTSSTRRRRTSFFDGKNSINQVKENSMNQKRKAKEVSGNQVKEYADVLEMFKVKKELFLDILQDPDVGISKHFPETHASNRIRKLKKSGSFPVADSSYTRSLKPSKLEHKQKEVWSFSRPERLLNGTHISNSTPFRRDDESTRRCITQEPTLSSTGSNHQRWDQLVAIRFKDIKQRIKEKMRRKSGKTVKRLSIDEKETSRSSTTMSQESTKTHADALDHDLSNNRRPVMRRTASLNESLDRYTQLFQHSSSKEPTLDHSRSLRLNNEDKAPSRERVPKFFRRISSLSDLESFCSILNEISRDALSSEAASNENTESQEAELVTEENDQFPTGLSEIEEADDINEDISKEEELIQPSSDSFPDTSSVQHPVMEGSATSPQDHDDQDEADTSFIAQDHCGDISLSGVYIAENNKFSLRPISDKEGDFCFNYVRDILELSGFTDNEFQEMWYSPDQPLNPSLFKELETRLHQKPECSFEEDATNCCHSFLFDLVNEALLEIADKSALPVYFPEAFSFSSHVFGAPKGDHIVQEVWRKVSRVMEFTPDPDQSLDDIVSRDLGKDSWMNLQLQAECVALDLEDLIFDELLEEIIFL